MSGETPGTALQTGSTADMVARMRAVLPFAWFPAASAAGSPSAAPVLDSVLTGIGTAWSFCFGLLQYVRSQARLATITGSFLDLFAADFFGSAIRRRASEADDDFRARITASLLIPRATRAALDNTLLQLVGVSPEIFEPRRSADTGAFGLAGFGYGSDTPFQYLVKIDANGGPLRRESQASYLDSSGRLRIAPRHAARPVYNDGVWQSFLVEPAAVNMLKDSVGWSGWSVSSAGGVANWSLNSSSSTALWSGQPVLQIAVSAGGTIQGPATRVFVGDQSVCASVWIWIPSAHTLTDLHLSFGDAFVSRQMQADLTVVDRWQRLVVALDGVSGVTRTANVQLAGASTGAMQNMVLTQCWQVEAGLVATSFIPSAGQIGIRDQDRVVIAETADDPVVLDQIDISEAIVRTIPAGSIAWLALQHVQ
jgi:hypothetical protein